MRFEKADKLLRLAMEFQARRQGMSIEDIQAQFRISRSTALRMKSALDGLFPLQKAPTLDDRRKRWRITPGTLDRLKTATARSTNHALITRFELSARPLSTSW